MRRPTDGAAFGTTFPHLFFLTFRDLVVDPLPINSGYTPRVFGFRVHQSAFTPDASKGSRWKWDTWDVPTKMILVEEEERLRQHIELINDGKSADKGSKTNNDCKKAGWRDPRKLLTKTPQPLPKKQVVGPRPGTDKSWVFGVTKSINSEGAKDEAHFDTVSLKTVRNNVWREHLDLKANNKERELEDDEDELSSLDGFAVGSDDEECDYEDDSDDRLLTKMESKGNNRDFAKTRALRELCDTDDLLAESDQDSEESVKCQDGIRELGGKNDLCDTDEQIEEPFECVQMPQPNTNPWENQEDPTRLRRVNKRERKRLALKELRRAKAARNSALV